MRCVKKIRVFERSEFRIFSNVLIFQVFWKHWPRLFGYFWGDAKSTNGCRSVWCPPSTASLGKAPEKTALAIFLIVGRNFPDAFDNDDQQYDDNDGQQHL